MKRPTNPPSATQSLSCGHADREEEDIHRPTCHRATPTGKGGHPEPHQPRVQLCDGQEREKHNSLSLVKGDGVGERTGTACCAPEIMVRSQPTLPLRAMSESVATHWQGLVLMLVAHTVVWMFRGCARLAPPFIGCIPLESWPQGQKHGRADPTTCLV